MGSHILLVEDDMALAMGTEYALKSEGYTVTHAPSLAAARQTVAEITPDLVLLDVMLPDGNGFEFIEEYRRIDALTPVIFLTAVSEEVNIVQGLDMGADDYVTKPYGVKELLSRIAAQLRKAERFKAASAGVSTNAVAGGTTDESGVKFGNHLLKIDEFRLYDGDTLVDLTPIEIRLLIYLANNKGVVIPRSSLIEKVYDTDNSYIDDNTLSVYMKRLRDKLGSDAECIETVRGIGYRFK